MKPQNLLTVDDVHITTATVSIQVIRIGAKQMTLAVFRQLPFKSIFDEWGNLLAPPWGWVNYEKTYGTPFIFSYEGVLYRSNVESLSRKLVVRRDHALKHEEAHMEGNRWIPAAEVRVPINRWSIAREDDPDFRCFDLRFASEEDARTYLENWRNSALILAEAPQLFIAV